LYLFQFLAGGEHSREDAQTGHKVDGGRGAEELEALLDEIHEADEAAVLLFEADAHDDGADDVGHGSAQGCVEIGGFRLALAEGAQETLDFALKQKERVFREQKSRK